MKKLLVILVIGIAGCSNINKTENEVNEYCPDKQMIKVFSGGFENDLPQVIDN